LFQSTLPAKGATHARLVRSHRHEFQSTLPAKGATTLAPDSPIAHRVSIHAPREGSDMDLEWARLVRDVSIHAPREGSDKIADNIRNLYRCFNPRSPRRERRCGKPAELRLASFNPRSPRRERRIPFGRLVYSVVFQSTLPAKGATYL